MLRSPRCGCAIVHPALRRHGLPARTSAPAPPPSLTSSRTRPRLGRVHHLDPVGRRQHRGVTAWSGSLTAWALSPRRQDLHPARESRAGTDLGARPARTGAPARSSPAGSSARISAVVSGRDHNTSPSDVHLWNGTAYEQGTTQWGRFCSADLAAPGAYRFGDLGTRCTHPHERRERPGTKGARSPTSPPARP